MTEDKNIEHGAGAGSSVDAQEIQTFNIAIIGAGKPLNSFLRMVKYNEIEHLRLNVRAICVMDDQTVLADDLAGGAVLLKRNYTSLFDTGDINVIVDLTGDADTINVVRRLRPARIPIIDKISADVMMAMFDTSSKKMRFEHLLQEEISRERQRIKQIFNSLPDAIMVTDNTFVISEVNDTFLQTNGFQEKDVIGKKCCDISHLLRGHCHKERGDCPLEGVLKSTSTRKFIHNEPSENGLSTVSSSITVSPILDNDGNVIGIIEASRDISTQIKLEEELLQSKIRLEKFIETAPVSISIKNLQGQYIQINKRGREDLGLPFNDIISKTDYELLDKTTADQSAANDKIVISENKDLTTEESATRGGKLRFYNTIRFPIYMHENIPVAVCVIAQDVTELKEAQLRLEEKQKELETTKEYLQNILENPSSIIVTTDMDHKIVSFNRGAELLTGYTREEAMHQHISFLYKIPKIHDQFMRKTKKRKGYSSEELKIVRKDKTAIEVDATISELQDKNGNPIGLVGIFHDISLRKQLQQQLIRTDRLAAVGKLGAGMAHEINNPTAVIGEAIGLASELAESDPGIRGARSFNDMMTCMNTVKQQAARISDITRRLLGFASQSEPRAEEVDVNAVIDEALTFTFDFRNFSNIRVEKYLSENLPKIYISPFQLQQVLANILDNAVDAIGDRKGEIIVSSAHAADNIEITIRDSGGGISGEYLDRVFDPFVTTKPVGKGTGLGLSISYGIITQMGGSIDVESKSGEGASFKISLPVAKIKSED